MRRGRFYRFFQYLSLFCFSMLGLVIAGNVAMVFVFWELVGICSYFLIGFYIERQSASNAANKAFIVNRVGDFGMIVGLMAIWAGMGTFSFADYQGRRRPAVSRASSARSVRPLDDHEPQVPDGMVSCAARAEVRRDRGRTAAIARRRNSRSQSHSQLDRPGEAKATATGCWLWPGWASSAAAWARAPSFRCTSGCPTPWKAPRPSAP